MSNLEKKTQMPEIDPTLLEKVKAESQRLTESGVTDITENLTQSFKTGMGLDLTEEEANVLVKLSLQQLAGETPGEGILSEEELDNVSGGNIIDDAEYGLLKLTTKLVMAAVGSDQPDEAVNVVDVAPGQLEKEAVELYYEKMQKKYNFKNPTYFMTTQEKLTYGELKRKMRNAKS